MSTCFVVVALPLASCLCFVVYAIFLVPGLELQVPNGVDLPGGHHLHPREYLYMVYWAVAGTIITMAACIGLTKLCKCTVKDFEELYGSPRELPRVVSSKSPLSLSPTPLPLMPTVTTKVQPVPAVNEAFVFDYEDELVRSLEHRLESARVLPLARSFEPRRNVVSLQPGVRRESNLGQRWKSMPFDRGFSLDWDDDMGLDEMKLSDENFTPESDALSPETERKQVSRAKRTAARSASLLRPNQDEMSQSQESLESAESFGSLLAPKRLFSVCEANQVDLAVGAAAAFANTVKTIEEDSQDIAEVAARPRPMTPSDISEPDSKRSTGNETYWHLVDIVPETPIAAASSPPHFPEPADLTKSLYDFPETSSSSGNGNGGG